MVLGYTWSVTMGCSGLYWPRGVLHFWVTHGVLPWDVVVSTGQGWCYTSGLHMECYHGL